MLESPGRITLDPTAPDSSLSEPLPPFAAKEMTMDVGDAVHCAYNVSGSVSTRLCPNPYEIPDPFAVVFHDVSVYPGSANPVLPGSEIVAPSIPLSGVSEPVPPLSTNWTTKGDVSVHSA
jgi:hypothetical protein